MSLDMVCDTGRHRLPACLAGAGGAVGATTATALMAATAFLRPGIATASLGCGDDRTGAGEEDDGWEVDATLSAKAMSLAVAAHCGLYVALRGTPTY
jgi:hypothetical protein